MSNIVQMLFEVSTFHISNVQLLLYVPVMAAICLPAFATPRSIPTFGLASKT